MSEMTASETVPSKLAPFAQRTTAGLIALVALVSILSLGTGATGIPLWSCLIRLVTGEGLSAVERVVLFDIRLPRLALGLLVGAALAVSGAVMQGLFRNPLADPGLVGVSAGAGLGAIGAIVLFPSFVSPWLVPAFAFFGGWASVILLYSVSTRGGRTSVATMLLAGIALAALVGAVSGVLIYKADDGQLRDLTFWGLGSLAGATWAKIAVAGPMILCAVLPSFRLGRALDALAMGEATAAHLGIEVQRAKQLAVLCVAGAVGAAVAVSGGIGFIGIVVPHLLRLATGPGHRLLLPNAALLGAALLIAADMIARVVVAPAELPIGIIMAILGAPVFLWILLRREGLVIT